MSDTRRVEARVDEPTSILFGMALAERRRASRERKVTQQEFAGELIGRGARQALAETILPVGQAPVYATGGPVTPKAVVS